MIELTKMGGGKIAINPDFIKSIEGTPRTSTITWLNEDKLIVEEPVREIVQKIIDYKRLIHICQQPYPLKG